MAFIIIVVIALFLSVPFALGYWQEVKKEKLVNGKPKQKNNFC